MHMSLNIFFPCDLQCIWTFAAITCKAFCAVICFLFKSNRVKTFLRRNVKVCPNLKHWNTTAMKLSEQLPTKSWISTMGNRYYINLEIFYSKFSIGKKYHIELRMTFIQVSMSQTSFILVHVCDEINVSIIATMSLNSNT